jgi:tetratricopeptide (TPR) repeat protein
LHLHKPKPALDACDKAIAKDPKLAIAHYNRSCALCLLRNKSQAISALNKAIKLDSSLIAIAKLDSDLDLIKEEKQVEKLLGT